MGRRRQRAVRADRRLVHFGGGREGGRSLARESSVSRGSCSGGSLDRRVLLDPEGGGVLVRSHALRVSSHGSVEFLGKDVGMPGVPAWSRRACAPGLRTGSRRGVATTPRGQGRRWRGSRSSRRCAPTPCGSGRRCPHGTRALSPTCRRGDRPRRPSEATTREGAVEHLGEVPGLPGRQVLDQAQEVRPSSGLRSTDVVLEKPVDLRENRLGDVPQVIVEMVLRRVVKHAVNVPSDRGGINPSSGTSAKPCLTGPAAIVAG
jgi:hypothetical protein